MNSRQRCAILILMVGSKRGGCYCKDLCRLSVRSATAAVFIGGIRLKPDCPRMPWPVVCKPLEIALSSDRRFKKRFARRIVLDFTKEKKKRK